MAALLLNSVHSIVETEGEFIFRSFLAPTVGKLILRRDGGSKLEHSTNLNFRIRPTPNITISFRPRYRSTKNEAQWVKNLDSNDDGDDDQFVFGDLKSQVWDVTTRLNLSFTPTMSAQFFLQQFVTAGNYRELKELAQPQSYEIRGCFVRDRR